MAISKPFSFEGWKVGKWIAGNKEFLKVLVPAVITYAVTQNWITIVSSTLVSKLILDIVDFYVTSVQVTN